MVFKRLRYLVVFFLAALFAAGITYVPLPYYITKPGLADELDQYVKIENGYTEKGDFMLVTVSMSRANVISYLVAKMSKYHEIFKKQEIMPTGESDADYQFKQLHLMQESQDAAIYNAYKRAEKQVSYENKGVIVLAVSDKMPAKKELQAGDQLIAVDEQPLQTAEEFIDYMKTKKQDDTVKVRYVREREEKTVVLPLEPIQGAEGRIGIGVQIVTNTKLKVDPEVKIDSHRIGGPSAGLMFTLEIYNQLTESDITKGWEIAGTGTMNAKGQVGPIGGISQKVVAASDAGAEIFFAPNQQGAAGSNYSEAVKTAKDIGTKMKIVPVDTLDDALAFLQTLEEKK